MRSRRALGAAVIMGFLAAGCGPPQLSRITPVAEDDSRPTVVAGVGDVLFLTSTLRGAVEAASLPPNNLPPYTNSMRLPLRHIAGADHTGDTRPLTPHEMSFLISVLAVNGYRAPLGDAATLNNSRAEIWDAIVDHLVLVRSKPGEPAQLVIEIAKFCASVSALTNVTAHFFPDCKSGAPHRKFLEISGILAGPTALDSVVSKASNLTQLLPNYYDSGSEEVAVSFAQMIRHGASMRNESGDEFRWSLADWQTSGICGGNLKVVFVMLRTEPFRRIQIVPKDSPRTAQFKISIDNNGDRIAKPTTAPDPVFNAISESDLGHLFPGDISAIGWGPVPDDGGSGPITDLPSPAHEACFP